LSAIAAASTLSIMSMPAPLRKPIPSVSTKANARAIAALAHAARSRAVRRSVTSTSTHLGKRVLSVLWAIAVAVAVFFGATALIG
jgi:hypothetical protein